MEIVRAVDDDVIVLEKRHDVVHREPLGIHAHLDIRIEGVKRQGGGGGLGMPTRSVVCSTWRCKFERSTTSASTMPKVPIRRGQVQRRRGAESSGPDQQHFGIEQFALAISPSWGSGKWRL